MDINSQLCLLNNNNNMKTTQTNSETMDIKKEYDLVKGDYTPEEGLEIISNLLMKKINFHELKSFSQQIKFGHEDQASLKRIEELNLCKTSFHDLVKEARLSGKNLRLRSKIIVELI